VLLTTVRLATAGGAAVLFGSQADVPFSTAHTPSCPPVREVCELYVNAVDGFQGNGRGHGREETVGGPGGADHHSGRRRQGRAPGPDHGAGTVRRRLGGALDGIRQAGQGTVTA